jgi:hypothetical protein
LGALRDWNYCFCGKLSYILWTVWRTVWHDLIAVRASQFIYPWWEFIRGIVVVDEQVK